MTPAGRTPTMLDRESELARLLGLPRVVWYDEVGSTLDVAHDLAQRGTPSGTLVLADCQTAGRGRLGRTWRSESGAGIWLTLVERPRDVAALDVLPHRIGLALAKTLDEFSDSPVAVKWPNDVYAGASKLAGILVEARWRDGQPAWIAVGVGINLRAPVGEPRATGLRRGTPRDRVLEYVIPAIRAAVARRGLLDAGEVSELATRHLATGRECIEPVVGRVRGIDATGSLLIDTEGSTVAVRNGSLVLREAS